jgi:hypothetical protein
MLAFSKTVKLYVFKDRQRVSLTLRVSDSCAHGYEFTMAEFETLLRDWDSADGVELDTGAAHYSVMHKRFTPRPERAATSYVRFSVWINGMTLHHRLAYDDMQSLRTDYFYQKHHRMHWDTE